MAVPNPVTELTRLQKLARRGLPKVTLVHGVSDFFRGKAIEHLLKAVPEDAELRLVDAVDMRSGGSDDDDGGSAAGDASCPELQDLRGGGLFARATIVVVRRGANWWKRYAPAVADLIPKMAEGCALVLEAPKLDKRKKAAAQLVKALIAEDSVFEFRDLYDLPYDRSRSPMEGELCKWVVGVSKKLGVPLEGESAWLMIGQVGKTPGELLAELQRLRDQLGDRGGAPPLTPKDLAGKLTCSFESSPFELAEAVLSGERRAAHRSLAAMYARGVKQKDGKAMDTGGLLPFTTSWLYGQLATLYEGRLLLESGTSLRDLPSRVGVRQFADRFIEQVRRNDVDKIQRGLTALHACQRSSRSMGEDPEVLLERFLSQWFDGAPVPSAEEFEL